MPEENDDLDFDLDFTELDLLDPLSVEEIASEASAADAQQSPALTLPPLTPGEFYIGGPGDGTAFLEAMLMAVKTEYRETGCGVFSAQVKWRHRSDISRTNIQAFCRAVRSAAHRLRLSVPGTPMFYVTLLKAEISDSHTATLTMARMNVAVYAAFESRRAADRFNKQFAQRKANMLDAL